MEREQALSQLIVDLKEADRHDDAVFRSLLARATIELRLLDKDLARELDASRPTVNRWKNGKSSPHPLLRRHIYSRLSKRAAAVLKQIPVAA